MNRRRFFTLAFLDACATQLHNVLDPIITREIRAKVAISLASGHTIAEAEAMVVQCFWLDSERASKLVASVTAMWDEEDEAAARYRRGEKHQRVDKFTAYFEGARILAEIEATRPLKSSSERLLEAVLAAFKKPSNA